MRRNITWLGGVGAALLLVSTSITGASAMTLRPCLTNHKVKVVKGHATMLFKGRRVACKVVKKAKPKPRASARASASPASTNPAMGVLIRFAGDTMNSLTVHKNLTVTVRNSDGVPHTLVIASAGISVLVPANDMSAFLAPSTPGTYDMTTTEMPAMKAILVVVP